MNKALTPLAFFLMACSSTPNPDVFSGYYRQGFEQSDFYTLDGEGPYWVSGTDAVFTELSEYLIRQPGRGSYVTVKVTFAGELQKEGQFGHIGRYSEQLYATQIIAIEPIPAATYDTQIEIFFSQTTERP